MTWTIIKITKIDDHQKLSAPIRVAKLFAKTATVFAAESVSLYGNEVNTHTHKQKREKGRAELVQRAELHCSTERQKAGRWKVPKPSVPM